MDIITGSEGPLCYVVGRAGSNNLSVTGFSHAQLKPLNLVSGKGARSCTKQQFQRVNSPYAAFEDVVDQLIKADSLQRRTPVQRKGDKCNIAVAPLLKAN
ncbi:unnamed protein product [Pleuronectes platessa]|uniref:Uncharacterized protein n=1 Tax=Pleuronectes platessa TaxID=8262 RepID=A0A9N7U7P3_PLEPL|nr:unnamed protein product [Pleuronectes platessa]